MIKNSRHIGIIIVAYQAEPWLSRVLESIRSLQLPVEYKVTTAVVDNASVDQTEAIVRDYPEVVWLPQKINTGFTGGNNIGFRWAKNLGLDYVFLLNQDAYCAPTSLGLLIDFLESHPEATAVQPQILLYPKTEQINTLGGSIHFLGFGSTTECFKPKLPEGISREVAYGSGAACLYRLKPLAKAEYFYEPLFLYHEDLDLGWIIKLQGGRTFLFSSAVVYHEHEFSRNHKKYYYLERNRWLVMLQNYHWLTLIGLLPALLSGELLVWAGALSQGWWRQKLNAAGYFLKLDNWRNIWQRRAWVQRQRRLPDHLVTQFFGTNFDYRELNNPLMKFVVNPLMAIYWRLLRLIMFW
jgi:hypothetical protein